MRNLNGNNKGIGYDWTTKYEDKDIYKKYRIQENIRLDMFSIFFTVMNLQQN